MDFDPTVIGGAGVLGAAFAAVWKLLPLYLDWLKTRKSGQSSLTDTAFKASGMSIESLVTVVNMLEDRIAKMRDEYAADIAALRKQYEEQLNTLSQRQIERVAALLEEISILKMQLAKVLTPVVTAQSGGEDIDEAIIEAAEAMKDSVNPREDQ